MKRDGAFDENERIRPGQDPFVYARAITGDDKKAKELVAIMKLVKEMGLTITPAYDDEREIINTSDKRYH